MDSPNLGLDLNLTIDMLSPVWEIFSVTFIFFFQGEPFPIITVEKLNAPFEDDFNVEFNGERLRLLVRHVEDADAGQYRITAQNETGLEEKDFNIVIRGKFVC